MTLVPLSLSFSSPNICLISDANLCMIRSKHFLISALKTLMKDHETRSGIYLPCNNDHIFTNIKTMHPEITLDWHETIAIDFILEFVILEPSFLRLEITVKSSKNLLP